jgi:hypothetical protein
VRSYAFSLNFNDQRSSQDIENLGALPALLISGWVAGSEANAVLAGLIAVATCAAGKCAVRCCGKAALHMFSFAGGEISYCFLVQHQFAQLLFHLERAS